MNVFVHQLRSEQLIFWRNRESAGFIFLFPLMLFLLLGSLYGDDTTDEGYNSIELLLAGFYEPVLAALPRPDRVEQIEWMHEAIRRRFGVDAQGLWLTERVWEPELAADSS